MASIITLFMSCSVKEPRGNCPCRLTVDLSDASEEYTDVLVSAFDKNKQAVYCCETIDVFQEKLFIEMQKSRHKESSVCKALPSEGWMDVMSLLMKVMKLTGLWSALMMLIAPEKRHSARHHSIRIGRN